MSPREIQSLSEAQISDLACGTEHVLALSHS